MSENHSKDKETRAKFVNESSTRIGGDTIHVVKSALKKTKAYESAVNVENSGIISSPLLASTPSTISKSLVKIYPYLILADHFLSVLTWTNENIWSSILILLIYIFSILYFQNLCKYFGHIILVGLLWCYSVLDKDIEETITLQPTLDDIVHVMEKVTRKFDMLLSPVTILSAQDIQKLLFTTIFLSPIYVVITIFILPPKTLLLLTGVYVLTYQSPWCKVIRRIMWRFKFVRLTVFYITGLDLGGISNHQGLLTKVHNQVKRLSSSSSVISASAAGVPGLSTNAFSNYPGSSILSDFELREINGNIIKNDSKPISFTYVLYENQRRWIGIGWTSSMLSYERTAWTDEFLNQAPSPEEFKLPEENSNMKWKWIDKTWRLDMTNDGAIQLSKSKSRTVANPKEDDGFIYYDNTWKKPSTVDSFSKYTRRRRWIRTAELISTGNGTSQTQENSETLAANEKFSTIQNNDLSRLSSSSKADAENLTSIEQIEIEKLNENDSTAKMRNVKIDEVPIIMGDKMAAEDIGEGKNIEDIDSNPTAKKSV